MGERVGTGDEFEWHVGSIEAIMTTKTTTKNHVNRPFRYILVELHEDDERV